MKDIKKTKKIEIKNSSYIDLEVLKYSDIFEFLNYIYGIDYDPLKDSYIISLDEIVDESRIFEAVENHESFKGDFSTLQEIIFKNKLLEITKWIEDYLNLVAKSYGYDDMKSCRSYTGYVNQFQDECISLSTWASDVWTFVYSVQQDIINGIKAIPSREEVMQEIPQYSNGIGPFI